MPYPGDKGQDDVYQRSIDQKLLQLVQDIQQLL
jgi:hypothetical protein